MKTNGDTTLAFGSVLVKDSNSKRPKEFQDVPIEVTSKEIYIGSNYKIKWKHVTSLRCKNNVGFDDPGGREDDYQSAGFELECVLDSKKNYGMEEDRTVLVEYPIPPEGQRLVATFWEKFRKAVEFGYQKELRKRQKKKDKEQARIEEELHEQTIRRKQFGKQRRSYSKRPYDFMRKNAANIAHNAEVWTDDEEEMAKETPEPAVEETPDAAEDGGESEQEFQDDFGNDNGGEATIEKDDVVDDAVENTVDDDSDAEIVTRKSTTKKSRIKRRGPVLEDSEDEDDDLFQTVEMTEPASQRVVTPKTERFVDDEDGMKDSKQEKSEANQTDDEEEEQVQNNKKINSFFQPRSKVKSAPKDKTTTAETSKDRQDNTAIKEATPKPSDSQPKNSFFVPKSKSSLETKTPTRRQSPKKKKRITATKAILDNDHSDSDEATMVVEENEPEDNMNTPRSPFLRAHSPKRKKSPFGIVRASESKTVDGSLNIEEEDPIEDIDTSQSQSPTKLSTISKRSRFSSGGRLNSSIKRRRLKINESRSALEALEYADARAEHLRSPVCISRKIASNATTGTVGERSPIQPLKLGPQVEMAVDSVAKWRGLRNDGNSCYVNSSLQQLFSVPSFMQALAGLKSGHELTSTLSDLYEKLSDKNARSTASAKPVKRVVDRLTNRFHGYQQRDAHEFLGEVIDQVHEELLPKGNDPTDEFFQWNVKVCLKCKSCGYSRSKEEMYRYLSIDIGHDNLNPKDPEFVKPTVDSCLAKFFAPEDREVNCEKCKEGTIATQTMQILSAPKVILLHLKRFKVVYRTGSEESELVFQKNKAPVELATKLSVDKLLTSSDSKHEYSLKSIVHHIGNTANSGHYTTDALRSDPDGDCWVSFDDGVVAENNLEKIVKTTRNQKTAYMLLYSRD